VEEAEDAWLITQLVAMNLSIYTRVTTVALWTDRGYKRKDPSRASGPGLICKCRGCV
jgi:hypothetical protein